MSGDKHELYLAYVSQLKSDHRQVRRCLARVDQQWLHCRQGRYAAASIQDLINSLCHLRAELAHHFAEEEAGGCVEEAVSHAPRLGREAADVEREDPELLRLIDSLIGQLHAKPQAMNKIETDFRELVNRIYRHEAAESRIVGEGFGMDVE